MLSYNKIENNSIIGAVVSYKGSFRVVVKVKGSLLQLLAPNIDNRKVFVKRSNIGLTFYKLTTIQSSDGAVYLVSPKGTIISYTTGKVMQWDSNNGNRKAILAAL